MPVSEARCNSCGGLITDPGVGHAQWCKQPASGMEYLSVTECLTDEDWAAAIEQGIFPMTRGGWAMTRRIPT